MATHPFVAGSTIVFDPNVDVLQFGASASSLDFIQAGADLRVFQGAEFMVLATLDFAQLVDANFAFAAGVVRLDSVAADSLSGSAQGDYFDIRKGGGDTVVAAHGDDRIVAGAALDAADRISGGTGADELRLSGTYASSVVLDAETITGVELIRALSGSHIKLQLHDNAVASTSALLLAYDGSAQTQFDSTVLDAAAVVSGRVSIVSGGGNDSITGGANADALSGGDGADTLAGGGGDDAIVGGLGGDLLAGGAGVDRFGFGFGIPRSESSPANAATIDTVLDFQGRGAAGGDLFDLPSFSGGLPLIFNIAPVAFTYSGVGGSSGVQLPLGLIGDGFADLVWRFNAAAGRNEIWVDANDDGQFSEVDLLIFLPDAGDGSTIASADFMDHVFPAIRLTTGNDTFVGGDAGEEIHALAGADDVSGAIGNDRIFGGVGNDSLRGGSGADTLLGQAGADLVEGGEGNDTLAGDAGNDTVRGGDGEDLLFAAAVNLFIPIPYEPGTELAGSTNLLQGEGGNDSLAGATGRDSLDGGLGNDALDGGAANDTLAGGEGADTLSGGADQDLMAGGSGADRFVFTAADTTFTTPDEVIDFSRSEGDLIESLGWAFDGPLAFRGELTGFTYEAGAALPGQDLGAGFVQFWWTRTAGPSAKTILIAERNGNFVLDSADMVVEFTGSSFAGQTEGLTSADFAGGTFSVIFGTQNADSIAGGGGNDTIFGLGGNDTIAGATGDDEVFGESGDDQLMGDDGSDHLAGDAGDDTLQGGNEADALYAGERNIFVFGSFGDAAGALNLLEGEGGNDTLFGAEGRDTLRGGADDDQLFGGDGQDLLEGNDGHDWLQGQDGSDTLQGGAGNDTLLPGGGADEITGGAGSDLLLFEVAQSSFAAPDRVTDFSHGEGDKIDLRGWSIFSGPTAFRGELAGFVYSEGAALPGEDLGSEFSQVWWARVGSGAGTETLLIADLNDNFVLDSADMVVEFTGSSFAGHTEDLTLADFAQGVFTVTVGTANADSIVGTANDDTIYGVAGNDTIAGATGDDDVFGQSGDDQLMGDDGSDDLAGGTGSDTLQGGNEADGLYAAERNFFIFGSFGDGVDTRNLLEGEGGNDTLFGAEGRDTLRGGADDDQLFGGDGQDLLEGNDGQDLLQGEGGSDTLQGGAGNDTLLPGVGTDEMTGGAGSDLLQFDVTSSFAAPDRVTDFSHGEGDKIDLSGWSFFSGPAVFRGELAGFVYSDGAALPGEELGSEFSQVWWARVGSGAGTKTLLIADLNDNFLLDSADTVLEFTGSSFAGHTEDLTLADFAQGVFTVTVGTANADSIVGTANDDTIYGVAGNDTIAGATGDDDVFGKSGDDQLMGDDGSDDLAGGTGDDTLQGGNEADGLYAGERNIFVFGSFGDAAGALNLLEGEGGNDTLFGAEGRDTLRGGADDDQLFGNDSDDVLEGNDGQDLLQGEGGSDTLQGGAGNDTLQPGGSGADEMTGGAGSDLLQFDVKESSFAAPDRVTDFSHGEGDKIALGGWSFFSGPTAFRGELAGFVYTDGAALPGADLGSEFSQVWWARVGSGAGTKTLLIADLNNDFLLDSADMVVEFTGSSFAGHTEDVTTGHFTPDVFSSIVGTGGADSLAGTAQDDVIYGAPGNDTIAGATGDDEVFGQSGDDQLMGDDGSDDLAGGTGSDTLQGGNQADELYAAERNIFVFGSFGDGVDTRNLLEGGGGNDTLFGAEGRDTLLGGIDDDSLSGDEGDDSLNGGSGFDNLGGGGGNDTLNGGTLADVLHGDGGDDRIFYGAEDSSVDGGEGFDVLLLTQFFSVDLDNAADQVAGGGIETGFEGVDYSRLGAAVTVAGAMMSELIIGTAFADNISGSAGNDTLQGGGGGDAMAGGSGDDLYRIDALDTPSEAPGAGRDTVEAGFSYTLLVNFDHLTLTGAGNIHGTGNTLANAITGNSGNNVLTGLAGNDTLSGLGGNDAMHGGTGNDTYVVDDAGDLPTELLNEGTDLVQASVTHTLGTNVENLTLVGLAVINGTGNTLNNRLIGNNSANVLDGGAGDDTMFGWEGDDTYIVNSLGDVVAEGSPPGGIDTVRTSVTFSLAAIGNIEHLTLMGAAAIDGTGNNLANTILGNNAINTLNGGNGNDSLVGFGGNDVVNGGVGNDTLNGGAGDDSMSGGAGNDIYNVDADGDTVTELALGGIDQVTSSITYLLLDPEVEKLLLIGTAAIDGTGNDLANTLTGNTAANVLDGGLGVDTMAGGAGNDTYRIDNTLDRVNETLNNGVDTVISSVTHTLRVNVENLTLTGVANLNGTGNTLDNAIVGNGGSNILRGTTGNDILTGGGGIDNFDFREAPGAANADAITDFVSGTDRIRLDDAFHAGIGALGRFGASDARFLAGDGATAGTTLDHRVIFNTADGSLYYDFDGSGAGASQLITTVGGTSTPILVANDIFAI